MINEISCFIFLGLVTSVIFYILIGYLVLKAYPYMACGYLWLPFFYLVPLSLFLGSILTGFLNRPALTTKWALPFIAPGLYFVLLMSFSCLSGSMYGDTKEDWFYAFLLNMYWYLASLLGTTLGYFLRYCISRCIADKQPD